ncbi:MAG: FkbM family methyltransferase [Gemmatimonadaceae bacterium]|nr:FkbM family methyltransferase [Gemmatimonadaceae bacterium]
MIKRLYRLPERLRILLLDLRLFIRTFGWTQGIPAKVKAMVCERFLPRGETYLLRWDRSSHFVSLRAGTSDLRVFKQLRLRNELAGLLSQDSARFVLDGGANIGLSTLLFAERYNAARILCVEPDPENVRMLRKNVMHLGSRVRIVEGAIWNRSTNLEIENPGDESWAFRVKESPSGSIVAYGITDLVSAADDSTGFDLVKLDIEGSERSVFLGNLDWLESVSLLGIELHDWLIPGCRDSVARVLTPAVWQEIQSGEYTVFTRTTITS